MLQSSTIQFLKLLKKNNNKEWFDKNRKTYELAKADYLDFVSKVLHEIQSFDNTLMELHPKQCVFRLNRDFIGGGLWMPMAPDLNKVRQEIDYCFKEFNSILKKSIFKTTYGDMDSSAKLVRPPKGFEIDNPAIEYLKLKSFVATRSIPDAALTDKLHFLNRAID